MTSPIAGAIEMQLLKLMKGIKRKGYNIYLIHPEFQSIKNYLNEVKENGIKTFSYNPNSSFIKNVYKLYRILNLIKPSIIHFNDPCLRGIFSSFFISNSIKIMTHHTPELLRSYSVKGRIMKSLSFQILDYIVVTSKQDKQTCAKKDRFNKKKIMVIPYGIDRERFSRHFNPKNVRKEFNLYKDTFVVGNVARLVAQKGHIYLIKAADKLRNLYSHKELGFVIVGDGNLKNKLETEVSKRNLNDYFLFAGWRNDIPRLLSSFNILVMPSLFEGQCLAVAEALAAGKPVVASFVGGIPSLIEQKKTGLLVPPKDTNALADALQWMIENKEKVNKMGELGKQIIFNNYTEEKMVWKTVVFYKKVINFRMENKKK